MRLNFSFSILGIPLNSQKTKKYGSKIIQSHADAMRLPRYSSSMKSYCEITLYNFADAIRLTLNLPLSNAN